MIPIQLKLSGFLSYRDPVEVDFTTFELACISGQNGAGKSSILDAITWVLFGQARKRDDTLINSASDCAEVVFTFEYEQNIYRIQRTMTRGRATILEFQIRSGSSFKVVSEATSRATQARIEEILHLDYETFINASFFLQGKADQFTQQRPTDRKRILASILGLEVWETYRERTVERRKLLEVDTSSLDGRLSEINTELAEESVRKEHLEELELELGRQEVTRKAQEQAMTVIKLSFETLKRHQKLIVDIGGQIILKNNDLKSLFVRQSERSLERNRFLETVSKAVDVENQYHIWSSARVELGKWDKLAESFREQDKIRQEPLAKIGAEKARIQQERDQLLRSESEIQERQKQLTQLESELILNQEDVSGLDARLKIRTQLQGSQVIIARFREQAKLRQSPLTEINSEKARLEQELRTLEKQGESIETQRSTLRTLELELLQSQEKLTQTEIRFNKLKDLEKEVLTKKGEHQLLKNNNERFKLEMEALDERIKKLESSEGAICPLCGQPLSTEERIKLINSLRADGKEKGDQFRNNKTILEMLTKNIAEFEKEIAGSGRIESDRLFQVSSVTRVVERIKSNNDSVSNWDEKEYPHLIQIRDMFNTEKYCVSARQNLARIDRELQAIGKALGILPSQEKTIYEIIEDKVLEIEQEFNQLSGLEDERIRLSTRSAQLSEQIKNLRTAIDDWNTKGKAHLDEIIETLASENFALDERKSLASIDNHLKSIGYDAAAHDAARRSEQDGRSSENELREVESARAALLPLERELLDISTQADRLLVEINKLNADQEEEQKSLSDLTASTQDMQQAERNLLDAQERVNIITREVGAAQQKVRVLSDLRLRKSDLETQREELAIQIKNHKTLERAFGKDGVPALLIEQALPQIEEKANELLDRLSNGSMSVRFLTQAGYKDKKRDDLKETLDIQISDGAGTRDYEMFSGGEAFRVNFAIRLALSEILARRTGARLQTLVIDEGFGSQDSQGRQRLIESINQVKADFAKILIITHLDELKEAFPNRIEVEKDSRGSTIRIL